MNHESWSAPYPFMRDRVLQLYTFFSTTPRHVRADNYWFYNISNLAYILIMLLHASWILVFYVIAVDTMTYLQFVSVAAFASAIVLNRQGYHLLAMLICLLEINTHQLIAVTYLGWASGFQNFIPLIALMPFLKYNEAWHIKILLCVMCLLFYFYIDFFVRTHLPLCILSPSALLYFNISNGILGFVLVALWGIVLAFSYQRSVTALIQKEQELFESQKTVEQAEILRQLELTGRDNEIYQLRNVALKSSNDEINDQKKMIEQLVADQEAIISQRTRELADTNMQLLNANERLMAIIQFNAHNIREPLTRITGAMLISEYMSQDEFYTDIWPLINKAANDLDKAVKEAVGYKDDWGVIK